MSQEELKVCPFCGHKVYFSNEDFGSVIECPNCFISQNCLYETRDMAIKAWNRRTGETK